MTAEEILKSKFIIFKESTIKRLLRQVSDEQISFSKMVELLNEIAILYTEQQREESFVAGCDSIIFVGGKEVSVTKFLEEYKIKNPL